jgi:hypothetical protein
VNFLRQRLGPLETWVWLAILTGLALAYYLYAKHKAGSSSSASSAPATPSDVGQPGVVVINQDGPEPTGSKPPPTPESKQNGVQEYAHGGETFAGIEKQYGVTEAELRAADPDLFKKYGQGKKLPAGTGYALPKGHDSGWQPKS